MKIGLLWHNLVSPNRGVSALTMAHIALLEGAFKDAEFYIFGYETKVSENTNESIISIPFGLREIINFNFKAFAILRECDVVIDIGEGDSFSDIYGFKRLLNQFTTKIIAKLLAGKLILAPQTYGPFDTWWGRGIAKLVSRFSDKVFARDDASAQNFMKLIDVKIESFTDVAFALPFDKSQSTEVVGINVSGLLYNGGYSGEDDFSLSLNYKKFTHDLIEYFIGNNIVVELISHVSGDLVSEDDYLVCCQLKKAYPMIKVAPEYISPIDLKTRISTYDFFIGARMHATIAAFGAGVPVIPVAYSMKFSGVFNRLNYWNVLEAKVLNNEEALEYVVKNYLDREKIREDLAGSMELAREYLLNYVKAIKVVVDA